MFSVQSHHWCCIWWCSFCWSQVSWCRRVPQIWACPSQSWTLQGNDGTSLSWCGGIEPFWYGELMFAFLLENTFNFPKRQKLEFKSFQHLLTAVHRTKIQPPSYVVYFNQHMGVGLYHPFTHSLVSLLSGIYRRFLCRCHVGLNCSFIRRNKWDSLTKFLSFYLQDF